MRRTVNVIRSLARAAGRGAPLLLAAVLACGRPGSGDDPPSQAGQPAQGGAPSQAASPGHGLREMVLSREFLANTPPGAPGAIRCVVMDWNVGEAVATLVAFDDGTTSLYFSNGGGVIGAGSHEAVRQAAARFRQEAASARERFTPVTRFDFPPPEAYAFYLVTDSATLSSGPLDDAQLRSGRHPLSELGRRAQEVIAQVRQSSERAGG